ncbi:LacI family DNA-binding transcriptional regulator [Lapidilactobacillus mulanensis]|uniref:LacI family DNA-binding transcriptional regulator n=1 Tax=Lapidilactobacillus mulanensis TaxID=2485999 RepID=A0ABW4DPR4_9LACO|nr:LacI family DNA-binding transcriptional regulator [Lapidilactobacillus mulanensis]
MVSIRDVAKMAGVSAASVSRILNNDTTFSINENTRQRVIETANQLHYSKEDGKHQHRFVNSKMTIGLILRHDRISEVNDPYFYDIHQGIELEAAKWRLHVIKAFGMRDTNKDWEQLKDYGAVIMIGVMTPEGIARAQSLNPNLILVDNYSNSSDYDLIQTDFAAKTSEILELLYQNGHRRIAFVGGQSSQVEMDGNVLRSDHEIRSDSYSTWMKLHDLQRFIDAKIGHWTAEDGLKLTEELIRQPERPTAIVVASDPMAMGVYKAINNAGLKIPEDISIVSFDDAEINRYLSPTLSSVSMDAQEMGRTAIRLARDRMLESKRMNLRLVCASHLKIRDSVKKLAK